MKNVPSFSDILGPLFVGPNAQRPAKLPLNFCSELPVNAKKYWQTGVFGAQCRDNTSDHTPVSTSRLALARFQSLVAPYRATLRYCRCDTPISCDTFSGRLALPQNGAITPPLVLSFTQTHACDTPFCKISRDICAMPHEKTRKSLAILSLQVLRDTKSSATGPLNSRGFHQCELSG